MKIGRETEVLRENLPQRHFVQYKSHMTWPGLEPGPAVLSVWNFLIQYALKQD
jgi:hypothetical protein